MGRKFLYQQITDDIMDKIMSKFYDYGDVLENSSLLMKRYNASIITINKALGLLAEKKFIKRIPGTGSIVQHLGTEPARQSTAPKIIGSIVADIAQSDMWAGVIKGIEGYLFPLNYQLLFGNDTGSYNRIIEYIEQFYKQGVKGIVLVPLAADTEKEFYKTNNSIISKIEEYGLSYIILHNILRKVETIQVGFDNYHDSCRLTDAIISSGCEKPILLSHTFYCSVIDERERGFLDTLLRHGYKQPEELIIRIPKNMHPQDAQPSFLTVIDNILKAKKEVDAVVAVDEYYLKMLHQAVQSDNCCIDFGVLLSGFGRVEEVISTNSINIYQRQNSSRLGEIAIQNLLSLIEQNEYKSNHIIRVPSDLIFSNSQDLPALLLEE